MFRGRNALYNTILQTRVCVCVYMYLFIHLVKNYEVERSKGRVNLSS